MGIARSVRESGGLLMLIALLTPGTACSHHPSPTATESISGPAATQPTFDAYIRDLRAGTPPARIDAASQALYSAGLDAFPALLDHFGAPEPADSTLQGDTMDTMPVGHVCFNLIQMEVEGRWPKAYRKFYVLTPNNARDWLTAHHGMSLAEMRQVANRESLKRAEAALATDPTNRYRQRQLEFFQKIVNEPSSVGP